MLSFPIDEEAAKFLSLNFLDPEGRYLVFTSHVFLSLDADTYNKSSSHRGFISIENLPISFDVKELRKIHACTQTVTPAEVALYGGIPSLIFSVKEEARLMFIENRVSTAITTFSRTYDGLLLCFLREVMSGKKSVRDPTSLPSVAIFEQFASLNTDLNIRWPLCYIAEILKRFESCSSLTLIESYLNLTTHSSTTNSSKDWELIIQFAIILQCIIARLSATS